jgi:outer membrane protein assembly factor BamA
MPKFFLVFLLLAISHTLKPQDTSLLVRDISLEGNKITKDKIIFREINFSTGDTIGEKQFKRALISSRENLLNTSLFNFVDIFDSIYLTDNVKQVDIKVKVLERWYIWPFPIFELAERNFSTWLQDMDFKRVNYGVKLDWNNFRGRKERLKLLLQFGYDEKLGMSYFVPYINKKQTIGVEYGIEQTKNHEVTYATEDNIVQRIRLDDVYAKESYETFLGVFNRQNIYQTHSFLLTYYDHIFNDTIFQLNQDFYPAQKNRAQYFKLSYLFKLDYRDFMPYPLNGYYFEVLVEKTGLGLIDGNEINILNARIDTKKFWKFSKRLFMAGGLTFRLGNKGKHPYFLNYGVGYGRDYLRGNEYYVVDGQDFVIFKTDFKFALVPQKVSVLKYIPTEKFNKIPWAVYLSIFNDLGYVPGDTDKGNTLHNTLIWGYGAGINIVSYYDIVFRLEYSFNQFGESGFFIHFMSGI